MQAKGIGFLAAWKIPGVAGFALTLFFAKLVAYTFLYWLPFYLSMGMGGGSKLSPQVSIAESRVSCRGRVTCSKRDCSLHLLTHRGEGAVASVESFHMPRELSIPQGRS